MRDFDLELERIAGLPPSSASMRENGVDGSASLPSPYFRNALIGYGLGLAVTFVANEVTKAGQPALVYLIPAVISSALLTAQSRGEVLALVDFKSPNERAGGEEATAEI